MTETKTTTEQKVTRLMGGSSKATRERDGYTRESLKKLYAMATRGNSDAKREIERLYARKFGE